jgi:hypothetical protein
VAVLKDIFCTKCETIREHAMPWQASNARVKCATCGRATNHQVVCNGGIKLKPFLTAAALAGREWSDEEVDFDNWGVESGGEENIDYNTGKKLTDDPRFKPESMKEEREEAQAEIDRKKGRTPLFFDSKGTKEC